ncbi:hypothetical protein RFI_27439 [Reticulomyxa filosa]|uniref:Uncharacterized protein n=1 Tax=Reticulomyxa filosa TaxID=46433 RepID=X6M8Z7_RETFI|nr:hypothetical protein RFI_27439 [Reticulomyxa filosa]|eukprot:ETO09937.1 hypothetical protein RFI_27439 [Reticulomyxa filosa]
MLPTRRPTNVPFDIPTTMPSSTVSPSRGPTAYVYASTGHPTHSSLLQSTYITASPTSFVFDFVLFFCTLTLCSLFLTANNRGSVSSTHTTENLNSWLIFVLVGLIVLLLIVCVVCLHSNFRSKYLIKSLAAQTNNDTNISLQKVLSVSIETNKDVTQPVLYLFFTYTFYNKKKVQEGRQHRRKKTDKDNKMKNVVNKSSDLVTEKEQSRNESESNSEMYPPKEGQGPEGGNEALETNDVTDHGTTQSAQE